MSDYYLNDTIREVVEAIPPFTRYKVGRYTYSNHYFKYGLDSHIVRAILFNLEQL